MNLPAPRIDVITAKPARPAQGGSLDVLATVTVDLPAIDVDRKPLNLALVIDRSGSMNGQPMEGAKQAASTAVGMLLPGDYVSVVTFDSVIEALVPLQRVSGDSSAILAAIAGVTARGSTDLYGGWAEGLSQVMACPDKAAINRVVLLSDGGANQGVRDLASITADVARAVTYHVTTTAMGLGLHYNEGLMRGVADAGHGNYVFLEDASAVVEAFEHELAGLGALRGRDVRLTATGSGVRLARNALDLGVGPARTEPSGVVTLPDLVAGLPLEAAVTLSFAAGASDPGLVLQWSDVITGAEETLTVDLDIPAVDTDAFAALPCDDRVTGRLAALRIAHAKLAASDAARAGDTAAARTQLDAIESIVASMPAGEARDQEAGELAELRRRVEMEGARMARYSEKLARARFTGRDDVSMKKMALAESAFRHAKLASLSSQPHAVPGTAREQAATVIDRMVLDRPGRRPVVLEIVLGDITDQDVDVLVNSSNRGLFGTSGVDGAIHRRAGPALKEATGAIGSIAYGEAVVTRGFDLPARYVVHTATPAWGATGRELQLLARCYDASFTVADRLGARSIALPAIGTGAYGYPLAEATRVAAEVTSLWLTRGQFDVVRFVLLDRQVVSAYLAELAAWRGAATAS